MSRNVGVLARTILCHLVLWTSLISADNGTEVYDQRTMGRLSSEQRNGSDAADTGCRNDTIGCSGMEGESDNEPRIKFSAMSEDVHRYFLMPIVILGAFGCVVSIVVLHRGALENTSASVYIRGIASANSIIIILFFYKNLSLFESVSENPQAQLAMAVYYVFIGYFAYITMSANVWTTMAFAVDRFVAIYFPMKAHAESGDTKAKKVVIVIFILAFVTNIPRFFAGTIITKVHPETNETSLSWKYSELGSDPVYNNVATYFFMITTIMLPIPLLAVFNLLIIIKLRSVRKTQLSLKEGNTKERRAEEESRHRQIQRVLVASLCAFLCCNVLIAANIINWALYPPSSLKKFNFGRSLFVLIGDVLYIMNPFVNFVLYVCCSKVLRDAVKEMFFLDRLFAKSS